MNKHPFVDSTKIGRAWSHNLEQKFITWLIPKIPSWLHSHHFVLMSIPISLSIIICGYLTVFNANWFWGVNFFIVAQWLTDSIDGALGRYRKEGLIRWGYYMDHLLDYFFLASILIAYLFNMPDSYKIMHFFVLAIFSAYMVNSYLSFTATNALKVAHHGIGPTEVRFIFIIINIMLIYFGKTHLYWILPFVLSVAFLGICYLIYKTQKEVWQMDMDYKQGRQKQEEKSTLYNNL